MDSTKINGGDEPICFPDAEALPQEEQKPKIKGKPFVSGDPRAYKGGKRPRLTPEGVNIGSYCRAHSTEIIDTMMTILRDPKARDRDRIAAGNLVLCRGHGQAASEVKISGQVQHQHVAATIDLDKLSPEQCMALIAARVATPEPEPIMITAQPALREPDE